MSGELRQSSQLGTGTRGSEPADSAFFEFYATRTHKCRVSSSVSPLLLSEIESAALPITVVVAALAAYGLYFGLLGYPADALSLYVSAGAFTAIIVSLLSGPFGLHSSPKIVAGELQARSFLLAISLSFLIVICFFFLLKASDHFSRGWLATWYGLTLILTLAERLCLVLRAQFLKIDGRLLQRVAIYGNTEISGTLVDKLFGDGSDLAIAGVYSDDSRPVPLSKTELSGGMAELIEMARAGHCDRVILALPSRAEEIQKALAALQSLPVEVQLCPDAICVPCPVSGIHVANDVLLLDLQRSPLTPRGSLLKSMMDYTIAATALVLLSPLMALIALAIKLDSRGPVFVGHPRHGYNQRVIRILKFRTAAVAAKGSLAPPAARDDHRMTRVGQFLRRTNLDELPQLLNVLKGDLSLVGPRPHAVGREEGFVPFYANRHKMKPGITGWAQVNGLRGESRSEEEMQRRLSLDVYYIQNWSPWFDVKILLRTLLVPFIDTNAC